MKPSSSSSSAQVLQGTGSWWWWKTGLRMHLVLAGQMRRRSSSGIRLRLVLAAGSWVGLVLQVLKVGYWLTICF
jgi:hypothetical protein